jgi:hypothetical protein
MRGLTVLIAGLLLLGCSQPAAYVWHDTRQTLREDAGIDFEACRAYAGDQYRAGQPAGVTYLADRVRAKSDGNGEMILEGTRTGEWRADRSPFRKTNIDEFDLYNVPTDYTGYPGEYDYYPDYIDEIVEECMSDRGWALRPPP